MNPIQKLIEDDRIEEAIEKLLESTKGDRHFHPSIQQLKSRFSRLNKENWKGVISNADDDLERNKITKSLLEISETIEVEASGDQKWKWGLSIIGIIVLVFLILQLMGDKEAPVENGSVEPKKEQVGKKTPIDSTSPKENTVSQEEPTPIKPSISTPTFKLIIDGKKLSGLFKKCLKGHFGNAGFDGNFEGDYTFHPTGTEGYYTFDSSELILLSTNGQIDIKTGIKLKDKWKEGGYTKEEIMKKIMIEIKENINSICNEIKKTYVK